VYYSLSVIYQKQGNPEDAEKVLKLWLELFPRRAGVGEAAQALATLKPIS